MSEKISDIDIEKEQKDNKIQFLEDKKGKPDSTNVEETKKLDLNNSSFKEKSDRVMNRLIKALHNRKNNKI